MRPVALLLFPLLLTARCGGSSSSPSTPQQASGESVDAQSGAIAPAGPPEGTVAQRSFAPWPGIAHNAVHRGAAAAVGPQNAHIRWPRSLEGPVVPGPAVSNGGVVHAASNGGVLHAIDLETGRDRWRFDGGGSYGSDLSTTPALLRDGMVLWPGPLSTLFALSSRGKLLWEVQLPAQPFSPAVAPDGSVVVADTPGTLEDLALQRAAHPTRRWRLKVGGSSYASPAIGSDGTAYTTTGDSLVAVRGGKVQWRYASGSESELACGRPRRHDRLRLQRAVRVRRLARQRAGLALPHRHQNHSSPLVTNDGLAYFGDNHGVLTTLDASKGALVSRVSGLEQPPGIWTAPAVDAHHDVNFGSANHIFGFDQEGRRRFEVETGNTVDSYPALAADGTLLISSEDGVLYSIGD